MLFVNLWKAVTLNIIEGVTEWLPISSIGHLILVDEFIKFGLSEDFMEIFDVVIQLGAVMTVVILYLHRSNPFSPRENGEEKKDAWVLRSKVLVACLPTTVIGLKFDDYLDAHFYNLLAVSVMLVVYGIAFVTIGKRSKNVTPKCTDLKGLTYKAALTVGASQVLALIPGTSRSGATILGAILIEASHFVATELSFFLGIPVMSEANFLEIFRFLARGSTFGLEEIIILIAGSIIVFVVSVITIKFLLNCLKKNDFAVFGWYHIVLGTVLIGY